MRLISATLFLILTVVGQLHAQPRAWYGGVEGGEGTSEGFCIRLDPSKSTLIDTLDYLTDLYHNYEIDNPNDWRAWKKVFQINTPFRIRMKSKRLSGDSLTFITERYLKDEAWMEFSFSGRVRANAIVGVLKSFWCPHADRKEVYPTSVKLRFTRDDEP